MYVCVCLYILYIYVCVCIFMYVCVCAYVHLYIRILQWFYCSPLCPVSMKLFILVCLFLVILCSILCDCLTVHSS